MQRVSKPELLDSVTCSPGEVKLALQDLGRVNRWFGGVRTTQASIERIAQVARSRRLSLLEVAAGSGEVPKLVSRNLARGGITVELTLLDRARSHLPHGSRALVGDALALPFPDESFDLVSCCLFAHHLEPGPLADFIREALRVSRHALLINDLVRHPAHLALVYAAFPLMRSRVAWLDGLTSVRRAYVPGEIREIITSAFPATAAPRVEIARHYLFRMGVIVWKGTGVFQQITLESLSSPNFFHPERSEGSPHFRDADIIGFSRSRVHRFFASLRMTTYLSKILFYARINPRFCHPERSEGSPHSAP